MAKFIGEHPASQYYEASKEWLVGDRFELTVFYGPEKCSFFINDKENKISSLVLTPRIGKDLRLFEEPDIKLSPSIDTCSICIPKVRHNEIFSLIEAYLLKLL